MAISAKISLDYTQNNTNTSYKTSKINLSNKSTYSKDFQETLSSTTSSKDKKEINDYNENEALIKDRDTSNQVDDNNNSKVEDKGDTSAKTDGKDSTKIDELKNKLEELEEDSKSNSKDKVNDVLIELMNLLAKLGINQKDLTANGKDNFNALQKMIGSIDANTISNNNSNNIMDVLAKLLKTDSVKENLNTDLLNSIQKILSNLNDNHNSSKEVKSGIKDLMSEISNIMNEKQNENGKVLNLEDLLNKNYSQDNQESSTENKSSNSNNLLDNKETSKEEKFLNSLADNGKGGTTDKINLFASRNEFIQNQGVDVSKNLTINKTTLVSDLITDVKYMSSNGLKELTVKINPENLGEVTISLTQEDGVMKANLKATSKDTVNLLMQNLSDIKNQLNDKNIKIDAVNIKLYQEDTTFFKNGEFNEHPTQEQQKNTNNSNRDVNEKINGEDYSAEGIQAINDGNVNFLA